MYTVLRWTHSQLQTRMLWAWLLAVAVINQAAAIPLPRWQNRSLPIDVRLDDLLPRLNHTELAAQLYLVTARGTGCW